MAKSDNISTRLEAVLTVLNITYFSATSWTVTSVESVDYPEYPVEIVFVNS